MNKNTLVKTLEKNNYLAETQDFIKLKLATLKICRVYAFLNYI